ncbi:tyrosine-type recombinase/integrase [Nakamurella panacisegetis]|uniref:tyrosine-type recombinase/integrase n=1 Tax=Nakamurella panacisegetis TaxID=1090615 RepID=UPI0038B24DB1
MHELAAASGKYGSLVLTLAYCGLRWGEATGLRVMDVSLSQRRLAIAQNAVGLGAHVHVGTPKTHHRRTVPVPAFRIQRLAELCEDRQPSDLVFQAPKGGYLRQPNGTLGWFEKAWQDAGVPRLTPHDLRHTAASLAVSAGANVTPYLPRLCPFRAREPDKTDRTGVFSQVTEVGPEGLEPSLART